MHKKIVYKLLQQLKAAELVIVARMSDEVSATRVLDDKSYRAPKAMKTIETNLKSFMTEGVTDHRIYGISEVNISGRLMRLLNG